jgi:hypothetical protein
MTDNHPTPEDPRAPFRHPELQPRPFRYVRAPYIPTPEDRVDSPEAWVLSEKFRRYMVDALWDGLTPAESLQGAPAHLLAYLAEKNQEEAA